MIRAFTPSPAVILAAVLALVAAFAVYGAYNSGYHAGRDAALAEAADAQNAQRAFLAKSETARLAAQSERDRIAQQLEDQANAAPAVYPACLDPDRVRRLNDLR